MGVVRADCSKRSFAVTVLVARGTTRSLARVRVGVETFPSGAET
jgi:hypothetical protein